MPSPTDMPSVTDAPPDGTRFALPAMARLRASIASRLRDLYASWGYEPVEVPVLERYDPAHPRAGQSFKLSDRDSGVLALRSDFTPALARLVRTSFAASSDGVRGPLRLQYAGRVWHAIDPELARTREFTQIGLELIGASNARADAELIHLARESVRAVGLSPRVEVGNPGFVRALFDEAGISEPHRERLADAIDRKDVTDVREQVNALGIGGPHAAALEAVCDLYGDTGALEEARAVAPWDSTRREVERVVGVISEFEDPSELLIDLGMARRLSYYTGVTFRAYTFDFGQPLLGGGRYDGALLPFAAGFSLGLERLVEAIPARTEDAAPQVLSLDDAGARRLRAAGFTVARALHAEPDRARDEARALGIPYLLHDRLEDVSGARRHASATGDRPGAGPPARERLEAVLRPDAEEEAGDG